MDDLLARMQANPAGDWTIADVENYVDHTAPVSAGTRTSHAHAKHPVAREIVTIPARRPIKGVYIRKLVRYIKRHGDAT